MPPSDRHHGPRQHSRPAPRPGRPTARRRTPCSRSTPGSTVRGRQRHRAAGRGAASRCTWSRSRSRPVASGCGPRSTARPTPPCCSGSRPSVDDVMADVAVTVDDWQAMRERGAGVGGAAPRRPTGRHRGRRRGRGRRLPRVAGRRPLHLRRCARLHGHPRRRPGAGRGHRARCGTPPPTERSGLPRRRPARAGGAHAHQGARALDRAPGGAVRRRPRAHLRRSRRPGR